MVDSLRGDRRPINPDLAAYGLIEIKAYGKCRDSKQQAVAGSGRQP